MMQRILNSRNLVAGPLAAAMGMELYFKLPFSGENVFLQAMAVRVPLVHEGLFYSCNLFLFTAPYTADSTLLSGPHVFCLTVHQRIRAGELPPYPDPSKRNDLFFVVGEIHNKRQPEPSETPHSLTLPEGHCSQARQSSAQSVSERRAAACSLREAEFLAYRTSDKDKKLADSFSKSKETSATSSRKSWIATGGKRTIPKSASGLNAATNRFTAS
jgi:hypothetical protein